jgi:hypothetical protein
LPIIEIECESDEDTGWLNDEGAYKIFQEWEAGAHIDTSTIAGTILVELARNGYAVESITDMLRLAYIIADGRNKMIFVLDLENQPRISSESIIRLVDSAYENPEKHFKDRKNAVMFVLAHGEGQHFFRARQKNFASVSSHRKCGFARNVTDECFVKEMEIVRKYAGKIQN